MKRTKRRLSAFQGRSSRRLGQQQRVRAPWGRASLGTVRSYGWRPQTLQVRMRLRTADLSWGPPSEVYSLFLPGIPFSCHQELHSVVGHTRHTQWGECSGLVLSASSVPGTFILVWEKALPYSEHDVPMSQLTQKHF